MNLQRVRDLALPTIGLPPSKGVENELARDSRLAGRLNLFQRMMLRWCDLHPYNPVHVVRVPSALDPDRLRTCIAARLQSAGLTGLVVDRKHWRFQYDGGPEPVALTIATAGTDPAADLARAIEREFNQPFASSVQVRPFRFLAIDGGESFQLALTYDHFVAGGDAIARLLTGIARAYAGHDSGPAPVERYPPTYRSLLLRHPGWALRALAGLPRLIGSTRSAHRPHYAEIADGTNAFTGFRLDAAQLSALRAAGAAWGVSLNDLLMAVLLQALSPLAAGRRSNPRRPALAVASILNMRQDFPGDAVQALSPCLAAFLVAHPVPDGVSLRELARFVHENSARIRRRHLYLQSVLALGVSALLWPLLSARRRHRFYPKHYPAWAGITTLNLNPVLDGPQDAAFDYLRAVPTGPLCPMVFAVTIVPDALHVAVSFRTGAFSRDAIADLTQRFVRGITELQSEFR